MKTDKKEYNGPGIYALINVYNLAVYIGSTRQISRRKKQHFRDLRKNKHANRKVQEYYKTGIFRFVVIQKLPESISDFELHHLEKLYIYDFCCRGGYDVCNHEADNLNGLKDLIFSEVLYDSQVYKKMNIAFKNEYGIDTWNMTNRAQHRRNE